MAKKRSKKQKQKTTEKRQTEYFFSESGVAVVDTDLGVATKKKASTRIQKKRVESKFDAEVTKLLYQDIRKTGIVTAVVFCILFGIYVYIR